MNETYLNMIKKENTKAWCNLQRDLILTCTTSRFLTSNLQTQTVVMATPADSPHMQLNIDTRSSLSHSNTDNNRDHSSKDGSYQSPQTPVSEYSHSNQQHQPSPYRGSPKKHQSNNSSNNNKRIYLDITGQFPYNEEEKKEKKEKNNNNNHHNTTHKSHKRKSRKKEEFEIRELSKEEISALEKETLSLHGYERSKFIATTLQGEVFLAKKKDGSNKEVVVKKTSKKLHKLGITITKTGKRIKVQENIVAEAELMQTFMRNQPPSSLIEYYDFFQDGFYFYLVMENGGSDYFG